jgi:hypothetical protein
MDKGIRPAAIAQFAALLPTRVNTREGNTAFRKSVIAHLEENFGITHAAGATHYNHAFIDARTRAATDPELAALLAGLGRPEDKKGGRKKKAVAPAAPSVIPTPVGALLQNFINAGVVQGPQQPTPEAAVLGEAPDNEASPQETVEEAQEEAQPEQATPTLYSVRKVQKGTVVAEGLTLEQANELIAAAAAAKKAKLELVV